MMTLRSNGFYSMLIVCYTLLMGLTLYSNACNNFQFNSKQQYGLFIEI